MEAKTPAERTALWIFVRLRLHIGEVNRLSVEDCTSDGSSTREGPGLSEGSVWNWPMVSHNAEHVSVLLQDRRVVRVAESRRRLNKRVEDPRQIEGCTANDFEYVGSGSLLLERLAQLVEQAGVLDGDDGLGGEVLN